MIELVDGRMWKRLLRYAGKSNYLMGAALSKSDVEDKGAAGEHDDILVTDMGILVNHAYTLLDVREVTSRRISRRSAPGEYLGECCTYLGRSARRTTRRLGCSSCATRGD